MWHILIENWTSLNWLELKSIFGQRRSEKNEVLATEMVDGTTIAVEMTAVDGLTGTIAVVDLSEMTDVVVTEGDTTETIVATTAATGNVQSAITTISLSDKNAIAAENREEVIVMDSVQTTEVSNAASNEVDVSSETTVPATVCKATGIARSVTMTTLLGELNATNVVHRSLEVKDGPPDGMTEEATTDLVTIDGAVTEEGTTVEAAVKYSTTTTGSALSAIIQISHSDKNAIDVAYLETVVNPDLVEMTDGVATEEVEMTDEVATEEVEMADGVVMTDEVAMIGDPLAVNLVNSEGPAARALAMLTTGHLVT